MQIQKKYGCYIYDGTIFENDGDDIYDKEIEEYKIIGHPVMIGDVMDYLDKLPNEKIIKILQETEKIFYIWQEKRKPITEQSDECIKFVYNLISQ